MLCEKCGVQVPEEGSFCPECGNPVKAPELPQTGTGYTPPSYEDSLKYQRPTQYRQPMKWFRFMIYFGLWAGAALNGFLAYRMFSGEIYGEDKYLLYFLLDGLHTLDVMMSVGLFACAALSIYIRFRLALYRKNGPKLLMWLYIGSIGLFAAYILGMKIVTKGTPVTVNMTVAVLLCGINALLMLVNRSYFSKRSSLFVKE